MNVRFGIMADAHIDFMHDGEARVRKFLEACKKEKCDFCIDLGDFCPPGEMNADQKAQILALLKEFPIPFHFVLGNHDMDQNSKADVLSFYGCKERKTAFEQGGVSFILVDACHYREGESDFDYDHGNYKHTGGDVPILSAEELSRLEAALSNAKHPVVLFSHQSLIESRTGIRNPEALRVALKKAPRGVLLAACGHEHVDRLEKRDGTYYWCVNSMSYYWVGEKFIHTTYTEAIEKEHPMLPMVFPYRDPLFSIVEIADEGIFIRGTESEIIGASPESLQFSKSGLVDPITASIKNRVLPIKR